ILARMSSSVLKSASTKTGTSASSSWSSAAGVLYAARMTRSASRLMSSSGSPIRSVRGTPSGASATLLIAGFAAMYDTPSKRSGPTSGSKISSAPSEPDAIRWGGASSVTSRPRPSTTVRGNAGSDGQITSNESGGGGAALDPSSRHHQPSTAPS